MTQREEAALKSRIYAKLVDSCTERYIHEIKKKNEEIIRLRVVAIEKEIDKKIAQNMTDFLIREKRPAERQQYLYGNQMLEDTKKLLRRVMLQ